jgi:hypothetical protein
MKDMILVADQNATLLVLTPNKMKRKRCRGGVYIISDPEEKNTVSLETKTVE